MLILFILIAHVIGQPGRRFPRPEKPGFYEIVNDDGSNFIFKKLPKYLLHENVSEINKVKAGSKMTAWDFRLLIDSVQATQVLNSGICGDGYALTAADVVGVAAYLNNYNSSSKFNKIISFGYEVACEDCLEVDGVEICQYGCNGGYPQGVLKYIADRGAVLKSCVSSSNPSTCPEKCDDGSEIEFLQDPNFRLVTAYNEKVSFLRDLLVSSGPCIAEMYVHNNLMIYTGDSIYKMPEGSPPEAFMNHVVVVYGFGVQDGQPYWLAKNTWGDSWGFKGYFKIEMGKNDSGFEEYFMCINNNVGKGPYYQVPIPPQPDYLWTDIDSSPDASSNPSKKKKTNAAAVVVPIVVGVLVLAAAVGVIGLYLYFRAKKTRQGGPIFGFLLRSGNSGDASSNRFGGSGGDDSVVTEGTLGNQDPQMPSGPFTDNPDASEGAASSGHGLLADAAERVDEDGESEY